MKSQHVKQQYHPMFSGGQFAAERVGQFAAESGGHFNAEKGGQFERNIQVILPNWNNP